MTICPQCGGPIVDDAGRGRPRTYCTRECQVAAYRERRDGPRQLPGRVPASARMPNDARLALAALMRAEKRAQEAQADIDAATSDLAALHRSAEERFGRPIPTNALLLDALAVIDIEDGDVWRWNGTRNNHGLATLKVERGEKSLVRFLAIEFGLIEESDFGLLYPLTDPDDVNPWHRELRASDSPLGNADRWGFTIERTIDKAAADG